ncbi:unnamed protein product [Rotaria sp. Silwood2]|nr:unnamed protein product [Rotaria sp. Silwood2]CAF2934932.1 unnamed protein product [Rotaria sp. Silwood2]CAF3211884.1 unnamed protein product [Rotaria sp. Silwood2]CAF4550133.1 unnamed protein product [Rotaria sp. Silwood2]CAF4573127.1 unnamed protein product [Rotaria sp. Silwood2]
MWNVLNIKETPINEQHYINASNAQNNSIATTSEKSLLLEINKHILTFTDSKFIYQNKTLETTIQCVGSLYNQSCLYHNLYYVDSAFMILTVKGKHLPSYSVRTNAFVLWPTTPNKRVFDSYSELEKFVRTVIDPRIIPSVTLHFGQPWHFNIGHALFDGLYPAYVALIRFSPRHLHPFRILAEVDDCNDCWSEDIYSRFGGLGIVKQRVLNKMSKGNWFMFEELVMGSGTLCQRCTQPNLQLPGGVELDASRLFRDRIYQQHGLIHPISRLKSSSERRTSHDLLLAYIIDNKRFTSNDRKEIADAINEINNYTDSYWNKTTNKTTTLEWPLVRVSYLFYNQVRAQNLSSIQINATPADSRSPTYELIENNFIAQLKILRQMDIHITGPGTGQMYQTFLSDGSVSINIGGIRPWGLENTEKAYSSYLEQHMTSGTPYIKGLYYPINERTKGIKKDAIIKLIREASQLILQGFSLPVNARDNLAPDGQLFVDMCAKDEEFCSLVTTRKADRDFSCLDLWIEDFVHEHRQWQLGGFVDHGRNISCPFNHSLLHELRKKYEIQHNETDNSSKNATHNSGR